MQTSESITNIAKALSGFQTEIRQPKKDAANPFYKSKYVPLENVVEAIQSLQGKHGLSYVQSVGMEGDNVTIVTRVMHISGEFIESDVLRMQGTQDKKGLTNQGIGGGATYGRRYQLSAMFGITSEEDDDGNMNTSPPSNNGRAPKPRTTQQSSGSASAAGTVGVLDQLKVKWQVLGEDPAKLQPTLQKYVNASKKPEDLLQDVTVRLLERQEQQRKGGAVSA
jgi:hypothetical protein